MDPLDLALYGQTHGTALLCSLRALRALLVAYLLSSRSTTGRSQVLHVGGPPLLFDGRVLFVRDVPTPVGHMRLPMSRISAPEITIRHVVSNLCIAFSTIRAPRAAIGDNK